MDGWMFPILLSSYHSMITYKTIFNNNSEIISNILANLQVHYNCVTAHRSQ